MLRCDGEFLDERRGAVFWWDLDGNIASSLFYASGFCEHMAQDQEWGPGRCAEGLTESLGRAQRPRLH